MNAHDSSSISPPLSRLVVVVVAIAIAVCLDIHTVLVKSSQIIAGFQCLQFRYIQTRREETDCNWLNIPVVGCALVTLVT